MALTKGRVMGEGCGGLVRLNKGVMSKGPKADEALRLVG